MVSSSHNSISRMIMSMGKRCGQIFMDGAETEKLTAGFYFTNQLQASSHSVYNHYFALLHVISGEGWFIDHEGIRRQLVPGGLMLRHPGKTHLRERSSSNGLEFACAVPTSFYLALRKAGIIDRDCYFMNPGLSPSLVELEREYVESFDSPDDICLVYANFLKLFKAFSDASQSGAGNGKNLQENEPIEKAKKLLRDSLHSDLDLPSIARSLGMGYESFRKAFRAQVGISPHRYRILYSLDKADVLLRQTDMLIKEIALTLGYNDATDFIRQYQKYRNQSPSTYREDSMKQSSPI